MANKGKNKGKAYERKLCEHLKTVFGLSFQRVPNSGAFTGGKNFYRAVTLSAEQLLLTDGDIIVPTELAHIAIEAKNHKNLSFPSFFSGSAKLDEWIGQAKTSKRLLWLLIFHVNNVGDFIVFDLDWYKTFKMPINYMVYKKECLIISSKGFFEDNKDILLNLVDLKKNDNSDILG